MVKRADCLIPLPALTQRKEVNMLINPNNSAFVEKEAKRKPCFDVGYWEYAYEREMVRFLELLERKALRLKELEDKVGSQMSEDDHKKNLRMIGFHSKELNVLYGVKLQGDVLKNCYLDSCLKIYNYYNEKNLRLEKENYDLKHDLLAEMNNSQLDLEYTEKLCKKIIDLENKIK